MKLVFYGSSLLSAYWNGAATYYRGLLRQLALRGWDILFLEPDAFDRQAHRDMDPPPWARVTVYPATAAGLAGALEAATEADVVIKASGVGVFDVELLEIFRRARPEALKIFWDVDAPATLAELRSAPDHPLRKALSSLDGVFTYGGGPALVATYKALGAARCTPIFNGLDPDTHHPVPKDPQMASDLSLLANRLPDREARIEEFFLRPASAAGGLRFLLGGNGWDDKPTPSCVVKLGHVPTAAHNRFNVSARAVLNVARDSMAEAGFSPATRVFEAAGAGACLITDAWEGVGHFLTPDVEILVARDGQDVLEHLRALTPKRSAAIGEAALRRVLADHTYARRAELVEAELALWGEAARARSAA